MSIVSKYEIDGDQAISTMQSIQSAFQGYNGALGQVISQSTQYNKIGGNSRQVLTQISDAGVKTTSVLKEVAGGYELISTRTSAATNAQRKAAEALKSQTDLSDRLAKTVGRGATPTGPTPSTTIPSVAPAKIGLPIGAYSNLTQAQLKAAAAANGLNAAQTKALLAIGPNSARAKQGFDTLTTAADGFKSKLEQVGKIAFATLIYRGISLIQQGLSEGTKTALDYAHQIGLIQTISQDSGETFDTWNKAIRGVADELGRPVTEVAKDAYDALSNQVIKSTKDFDLLRTAITLEQNTGSSPGTGLNTLSALINGLGVSSLQAQTLADKLFVTIDKGRVRLEELDKVLGRSVSLQQQAGASFDETAGALAVLTQSGIDSAEATTLLNNVYSEIIKPNEALSAAIKKLGYDTGAAAVQGETLVELLKKLGDIAKTTPNGLATFFPDIRGLRGVSTLFTQTENFRKSIEAIQNSQGANKAAKGILDENEAQRILKETERIKNYFTVDLGVGIIRTLAKISDSVGGFANVLSKITPIAIAVGAAIASFLVIQSVITFTGAIGSLAVGFTRVAVAIGIADGAALAFGKTVTAIQVSLGIFAAVATATFLAATYAADKLASAQTNAANARFKPIDEKRDKTNDDSKELASKRVEDFNRATDKMTSTYSRFIATARKLNTQFAENAKSAFEEASDALKNSFDIALTFIRKNVNELEQAEEKSLENLKKLSEEATDVRRDAADRQRQYQTDAIKDNYDEWKKYNDATGRSNFGNSRQGIDKFVQIANQQIAQARRARDQFLAEGDLKGAAKEYDKINEALSKFKSNVESVDGKSIGVPQADAYYAQEQYNKILGVKKQIEAQNQKEYNQALQQRQVAEKLNDVYKEQAKFGDQVFDKKGNLTDQFAGDPAKALKELDALNAKRHDLQSQLAQPKNPIEAARLNQSLTQADQDAAAQRNALAQRLAAAQTDSSLSASSQARQALAEAEKKSYASLTETILQNNKKLADGAAEIKKLVGEISQGLNNPGQTTLNFGNDAIGGLKEALRTTALGPEQLGQAQQLLADIRNLANETNLDVPKIKAKLAELQNATASVSQHKLVDPKDVTSTISIQEAISRISGSLAPLKEAKSDLSDAAVQMLQFKNAVSNINAEGFNQVVGTIQSLNEVAGGLGADAGGVEALANAMNTAAAAARNEAAALRELNAARGGAGGGGGGAAPEGGGAPEGLASGGSVGSQGGFLSDFYSGKFAKGSDIIPAMLSRGEYVINAAATRKFYSQLVAMNAGTTPIYRSEGGGTGDQNTSHNYSINVGGGGGTPKETAKVVVQAIRRAQRQGTVK